MQAGTREQRLRWPGEKVDAVIDTDAYNEIDDLYAIAYMLRSNNKIVTRAIIAAPFYSPAALGRVRQTQNPAEGMELSYRAIEQLLDIMDMGDRKSLLFRGAKIALKDEVTPAESEGIQEIIRLAREHTPDRPLYVIGIAVLTDIASAILKAPDIVDKIVVVWLGGHGYDYIKAYDFNALQDIAAARVVFGSGAVIVHLPCMNVISDLTVTKTDLEENLHKKNKLCTYLLDLSVSFMREKMKTDEWVKPLWDVSAVAWLINPDFMETKLQSSPVFEYDDTYRFEEGRPIIRTVIRIDRHRVLTDMFFKLSR